ncbi:MAG TPA: histidine kinase [Bacteroidota bacterium]|nr:histidine kinase [Bacteroidota bacterium]
MVISIGFGMLFFLMLLSVVSLILIASALQGDMALILDHYAQSVRIVGQVQTDATYLRLLVRDLITTPDAAHRQSVRQQIDSLLNETTGQFSKTLYVKVQPEEGRSFQEYIKTFDSYADAIRSITDTIIEQRRDSSMAIYTEFVQPIRQALDEKSRSLVSANLHASAVTRDHITSLETEFLQIGVGIAGLAIIISVLIYYYVSQRFRMAQKQRDDLLNLLRERQKKIEQLVIHMSTLEEDQRKRFAQELHDAIGHGLTVAKFHIDSARAEFERNRAVAADHLEKSLSTIQQSLLETKRISYDMRPTLLDDLGLVAALNQLITDFERRTGTKVSRDFGSFSGRFRSIVEITVYRIVQEAFINIEKHAEAKHVSFQMFVRDEGVLVLSITDDGKGFDVGEVVMEGSPHLGLRNILERGELMGGTVLVESRPGKGCEINIEVPIDHVKEVV